jgi:hypothetical protein
LSDLRGNSYPLGFTISGGTAVSTNTLDVVWSQPDNLLFSGSAHAVYGQPTATGGVVSPTNRSVTADFNANGISVFDGLGEVTLTISANTNKVAQKLMTVTGTYTLPSTCYETVTLTSGLSASFGLVRWNSGSNVAMEEA